MLRIAICLILVLALPPVFADGHIRAIPAEPAESVVPELQGVVVLCATKPNSAELEDAWTEYLEYHYDDDTDLDRLIDTVISRANAHRRKQHSRTGTQSFSRAQRDETKRFLHDTAKNAIQNVR
ncbi:MAG: hypothetical protein QNJ73_00350 [Gammaproteobacteria bacterium]|nr:hypothetical protein [Gammaproteobacteria bacterium]